MISSYFIDAVGAFQEGAFADAAAYARLAAASDPSDNFYRHAVTYLEKVAAAGTHDMYATPDGFVAFVRGGGNVPLYTNLSEQLKAIYDGQAAVSLLDIGVGDGLALLPALSDSLVHVDLVEPAAGMLDGTLAALAARGLAHRGHHGTIESFIGEAQSLSDVSSYDIAQATFALHNLAPETRALVLAWLKAHCSRLLIAEFDVQIDVALGSAEHIDYLATRYRDGLAEYEPEENLVAQGFLMPILFRNFESIGESAIYEQSIDSWQQELELAGFTQIERRLLHHYWWADAWLMIAS